MAFTNKAYCSVDDVKAAMDSTSTANDDLIQQFIAQAQSVIDEYLGFNFQTDGTVAAPATRLYDGNAQEQLLIDPCLNLIQVQYQSYSISGPTRTTTITADVTGDCFLGPVGLPYGFLIERVSGLFPIGKRNILVSGVFGKFAQVPGDIKRACTRLAIHYFKQMDASYQNKTANGQFGALVFEQDIPSDICKILDRHKPRIFRGA